MPVKSGLDVAEEIKGTNVKLLFLQPLLEQGISNVHEKLE